jgi:hypothetical protein
MIEMRDVYIIVKRRERWVTMVVGWNQIRPGK